MSISGVNGIGATAYAYMNSSMKTTGEGNFASEVQKAEERQSTTSTTSAWAGDMIISQPPNYSGFTYDSSISNKTKQIKEAQEKARAQKELAWANYLNSQLVSQQRLQGFLIESVQSGQDRTNISAFQPMGVSAYEDTISTFSKIVIESQKL